MAVLGAVAAGTAFDGADSARALTPTTTGAHKAVGGQPASAAGAKTLPNVKLRQGARGEAVRSLQGRLNDHGQSLRVDGKFGPATNRGVRSFQSKKGLQVDGVVGIRTRTALNGTAASASSSDRPKLRRGDRNDAVRTLQEKLNAAGASLNVDGKFGPSTNRAVRSFQSAAGIGVDGVVGPRTWKKLDAGNTSMSSSSSSRSDSSSDSSDRPKLRRGDRNDAVRTLQEKLNAAGASLNVDGKFGPSTNRAVRSFQSAAGIGVDGVVGPRTWKKLDGGSVRLSTGGASRGTDRSAPPASSSSIDGSAIASAARNQVGSPYVWGASSPSIGFDCSGLVHYAYNAAGVDVPRRTAKGYTFGGRIISKSEAQPGDLVSFTKNNYGHIGIYLGNGRIVDASGSRGRVVERSIWNSPHVFVTYR